MSLVVNITRVLSHLAMVALWYWGEIPWWVAPLVILWDTPLVMWWRLPGKRFTPPEPLPLPEFDEIELSKLLQLRATMTKQDGEVLH